MYSCERFFDENDRSKQVYEFSIYNSFYNTVFIIHIFFSSNRFVIYFMGSVCHIQYLIERESDRR